MQQRLAASLLLVLTCSLSTTSAFAQESNAPLPAVEKLHLFLLVGQSNMAGRGTIAPSENEPHPRVLMLTREGKWVPAVDPLHFDKPTVVGVGLGRTFANEIANANPDATIGLVPCAVGGSPISVWEPEAYYPATDSHPWDDSVRRAKRAMQDGTLKGILWHQGESDANKDLSGLYEDKLHDLITRFRKEFDAQDVPFIVGQMGQFEERPWDDFKKQVDAAHQSLPQQVPHTAFVSSDGLTHKGDEVHFDTPSYQELGRRYARAYLQLVDPQAE